MAKIDTKKINSTYNQRLKKTIIAVKKSKNHDDAVSILKETGDYSEEIDNQILFINYLHKALAEGTSIEDVIRYGQGELSLEKYLAENIVNEYIKLNPSVLALRTKGRRRPISPKLTKAILISTLTMIGTMIPTETFWGEHNAFYYDSLFLGLSLYSIGYLCYAISGIFKYKYSGIIALMFFLSTQSAITWMGGYRIYAYQRQQYLLKMEDYYTKSVAVDTKLCDKPEILFRSVKKIKTSLEIVCVCKESNLTKKSAKKVLGEYIKKSSLNHLYFYHAKMKFRIIQVKLIDGSYHMHDFFELEFE